VNDLHGRVKDGVSRLKGLDIGDELAVEILSHLVEGRKSVAEITEHIYGLTSKDEGYNSSYSRVRREIRRLESKGLVSRPLFGGNRPFRLTDLALINLARIGGQTKQLSPIPRIDLAVHLVTAGLAFPVGLIALAWVHVGELATIGLFGCFCFLLGVSFCRITQSTWRVF
jgi:DNA-binding transcriptional ArsR family regulator